MTVQEKAKWLKEHYPDEWKQEWFSVRNTLALCQDDFEQVGMDFYCWEESEEFKEQVLADTVGRLGYLISEDL